jgi:hypothetical protein
VKIRIHVRGKILAAKLPHKNADYVVTTIAICKCGSKRVRGRGIREQTHDTYIADAMCVECGEAIGSIHCTLSTIFGLAEDERVLNGRCRVY